MRLLLFFTSLFFFAISPLTAQQDSLELPVYEYGPTEEFEIGGIRIEGAFFAEENAILGVTGLSVGDKIRIPGPDIPKAIRNLWKLRLFTNAAIEKEKTIGNVIFLIVRVEERPRLLRHSYAGVKQTNHDDLNEAISQFIVRGGIVTQNTKDRKSVV